MGSFMSLLLTPLLRILSFVGGELMEDEEPQPLSELLEALQVVAEPAPQQEQEDAPQNILWTRICRRLRQYPEEAACYCHTVDPSPLLQCLTNTPPTLTIPVAVIQAFLDAYEDAVFSSDANGLTPLLAATKRASILVLSSEKDGEQDQEGHEDQGQAAVDTDAPSTSSASSEIIELLLQANPFAAQQTDKRGRLPLHHVRSDLVTAHKILQAYPSAVAQKDKDGRLPLHYYCELEREAETQNDDSRITTLQLTLPNLRVAKLLLQAATAKSSTTSPVLHKDKKGITPLDLFYQSLLRVLQDKQPSRKNPTYDLDQLWELLTLLIHSATPTSSATPPPPMVHALVSLHCPATIIQEALRRYPHQAVERDSQGRTPLLLAVSLLDNTRDDTQAVISQLLQTNRRAARMTDKEGRLAIDVLSEKRHAYSPELYDLIVQAEPRAIDTRDLKNKQHPFLTAAMAGNSSGVYHLLRAKPHVIRYFLNEC